jgi:hypothetical protein
MIKPQDLYGGVHVISPQLRVGIAVARLIREAVTANVHGDKAMVIGQVRTELPVPCEPTLRKAMDEQDWPPARSACLNKVELNATAARYAVIFHRSLVSLQKSLN